MKASISILLVILTFSLVLAQKITTDVDDAVDFTRYKTYQFLSWQDNSDRIINDLDKKRLRNSFESELAARKLEQAASEGDLAITIYIVVTVETSTTAYTNYYGGTGYR